MEQQIWALLHSAKNRQTVFGVSFPDFPGVASGGKSMEEALARGRATLVFHLAGLIEDGEEIPTLRSLDALRSDADVQDAVRNEGAILAQVAVDLPGKPVRVNISIDEGLLGAIDRAAKAAGKTRSGYLAEAAQDRLRSSG